MRRENPSPIRPGAVPLFAVALLALPLLSCLQPTSVECGPNLACPAGKKCAAKQDVCIETDCGDDVIQAGEECDDGNIIDGDGCSAKCHSTEVCGNGITDTAIGEVCDDGEDNAAEGGCSVGCRTFDTCGNKLVDPKEECDSGGVDTKTCNGNCTIPRCGDGRINMAADEVCEPGDDPSCNTNCQISECGDGIVNTKKEQCDGGRGVSAGKARNTETCNEDCTIAKCGDGYVNSAAGEQCELGDNPSCTANCKIGECGDGIVNPNAGEQCDGGKGKMLGKAANTDTCDSDCTVAYCGDGYVNDVAKEDCEPSLDPTCNPTCETNTCGDGIVNASADPAEVCDDGNRDNCGTCNINCTKNQEVKEATGRIIVKNIEDISDGEVLILGDRSKIFNFEFEKYDDVFPGRIAVNIATAKTPIDIADAIKNAIIKETNNGLRISVSSVWNVLMLKHDDTGDIGNVTMIEDSPGINTEGMEGGAGFGCRTGMRCKYNKDCASGSCESGICK